MFQYDSFIVTRKQNIVTKNKRIYVYHLRKPSNHKGREQEQKKEQRNYRSQKTLANGNRYIPTNVSLNVNGLNLQFKRQKKLNNELKKHVYTAYKRLLQMEEYTN